MSRKQKLMERLDKAAEQLLDRTFQPVAVGEAQAPLMEQIKVFESITRYFGPRTKVSGDEDHGVSEFEQLRNNLNNRTRSRRRSRQSNGDATGSDDAAGTA